MVEVYDTETGSKLLDENYIHEIEVEEMDAQTIREKKEINTPGILEAIEEIGEEMASNTCDVIGEEPWKGFIVAVNGDTVTLSSGQKAGLKTGQRLNVYSRGDIIEGKDGRRFFLPGMKTGEIKIVSVLADQSEAVSVSGETPTRGASVRVE